MEECQLSIWDDCREKVLNLSKSELIGGSWRVPHGGTQRCAKDNLVKDLVETVTQHFPSSISFKERLFHVINNYSEYLDPKCPMCGKGLPFYSVCRGYNKFCSYRCSANSPDTVSQKSKTYLDRSGYSHPSQNPIVKKQKEDTHLGKTGYRYTLDDPNQVKRMRDDYRNRTGYDSPMHNPSIIQARDSLYREKTGYSNPGQNPEVRLKMKKSLFERTGYEYPYQNLETIQNASAKRAMNWHKSLRCNYSKISQELFDAIYKKLPEDLKQECYYATCKTEGHNKEFGKWDSENNSGYFYDFVLSHLRVAIEFDGTYWHEKVGDECRDRQKQIFLEKLGFSFFRIKESEYCEDKHRIVCYCLNEILLKYNLEVMYE